MSEIIKPLMLDETGKAIVEALTQQNMTQNRIAEINAAADAAKAGIQEKTDEQAARIPEVTMLAEDVNQLKDDLTELDSRLSESISEISNDTIRLYDFSDMMLEVGGLDTVNGVVTSVTNRARSGFLNIAKGQSLRVNDGFEFFVLKFKWDNTFISSNGWFDSYEFEESARYRFLFKNDSISDMTNQIERLANAIDAASFFDLTSDSIKRLDAEAKSIIEDYGYYINISNPPKGYGLTPCVKDDPEVDNSRALQGILDFSIAHNLGVMIDGIYYISNTIFIKSGIQMRGINPDESKLMWNGSQNTMIAFGNNNVVRNVNFENLTIGGNNKASYGVRIYSAFYCTMKNVIIRDCRANCMRIYPTTQDEAAGTQWCVFSNLSLINADTPLWLDSTNPLSNVCHNTFISLNLEYIEDGIYAGDCDNNTFIGTFTYCYAEDKKYGVKFSANARNNYFYHFQGTCYAFNGSRNVIYEYDVENNQALPVIDGEAKLFYTSLSPARSLMRFGGCSDTSVLPTNTANIGDCIYYRWPKAGGYIGAVFTSSGWKEFGKIES